jgi:hypothetical protein
MSIGYYLVVILSIAGQPAQVHTLSFLNLRACMNGADEFHDLSRGMSAQTMCLPTYIEEQSKHE